MYPQYLFELKYKNSQNNSTENCHFYRLENRCILHGRVFVMTIDFDLNQNKDIN